MSRGRPDHTPTAADVVTRAEWAAAEASDKNVQGSQGSTAFAGAMDVDYTVPASTTLYLVTLSIAAAAIDSADADKQQTVRGSLLVAGVEQAELGGNGGQVVSLSKPIRATAAQLVRLRVFQYAAHNSALYAAWHGYERGA